MLRKTAKAGGVADRSAGASMRPQRNAAENAAALHGYGGVSICFNEAAA